MPDAPQLVYYGPHACPHGCGGRVIRTGNEYPDLYVFDAQEGPVYPNTRWKEHQCVAGIPAAPQPAPMQDTTDAKLHAGANEAWYGRADDGSIERWTGRRHGEFSCHRYVAGDSQGVPFADITLVAALLQEAAK